MIPPPVCIVLRFCVVVIGDGFEKIDTVKMRDNGIMYALSRYGDLHHQCKMPSQCNGYRGEQTRSTELVPFVCGVRPHFLL